VRTKDSFHNLRRYWLMEGKKRRVLCEYDRELESAVDKRDRREDLVCPLPLYLPPELRVDDSRIRSVHWEGVPVTSAQMIKARSLIPEALFSAMRE